MSYTGTVKQAFLNKHTQSRLKPACALVVETWKALILICHIPQLQKRDARNLKNYHIQQSSNVKLFSAQRRETVKPLQFFELMKATFDSGRNTRQRSAGVGCHKGNSLDPRNNNFLKLMMQSSCFCKINYCIVLFLRHIQRLYHFSKIQLSTTNLICMQL
jgi:hypothetical protein